MQQFFQPEPDLEQARDDANAWIARFAPLVMDDQVLTDSELRQRLLSIEQLRNEGPAVRERLQSPQTVEDHALVSTLDKALGQLDSLESDYRRQLGKLAPGDPDGIADLEKLNDRLAERLARQEIGVATAQEVPEQLELKTSTKSWGAALFLGLFGLGWTSFTTVHAIFMIGGMFQAFGFLALALLLFYALFWAVGFGVLYAALNAASDESISIDGRELVVRRKLGAWLREKRYTLAEDAHAEIVETTSNHSDSGRTSTKHSITLLDTEGRQISFGQMATPRMRDDLCKRINAYLKLRA